MKVIVKTQIHGCFAAASSFDRYAYKVFDLPFAPFEGLTIEHKTKKGETDSFEIKEAVWDCDKKCFICYTASDREIYDAVKNPSAHRPMAEIVDDYMEADWLFEPINIQGD